MCAEQWQENNQLPVSTTHKYNMACMCRCFVIREFIGVTFEGTVTFPVKKYDNYVTLCTLNVSNVANIRQLRQAGQYLIIRSQYGFWLICACRSGQPKRFLMNCFSWNMCRLPGCPGHKSDSVTTLTDIPTSYLKTEEALPLTRKNGRRLCAWKTKCPL